MGKTAAIIGNGQFPQKEYPLYLLDSADYVICCDGAADNYFRYCRRTGRDRLPDVIIGDLDSLSRKAREKYRDLVISCEDQQTNDQTKAFNYVADHLKDVSSICFLGATGKREDHTVGNISLLMQYARERNPEENGLTIQMVSDFSTMFPVTDSTEIDCGLGRKVSIFTDDATLRIKSEGLEWPTDDVIFDSWWKATLNRASADTVKLTFSHPSAAVIVLD